MWCTTRHATHDIQWTYCYSGKAIRLLDIAYCVSRVASYIALVCRNHYRCASRDASDAGDANSVRIPIVNSANRASGGRTISLFALITVDAMAAQWIRTAVSRRRVAPFAKLFKELPSCVTTLPACTSSYLRERLELLADRFAHNRT